MHFYRLQFKRFTAFLILSILLIAMLPPANQALANTNNNQITALLTLKGSAQGELKGRSSVKGFEKSIPLISYRLETNQISLNHPTNEPQKRIFEFAIVKYIDTVTSKLMKASKTAETFSVCKLTLLQFDRFTQRVQKMEFSLTDALIVKQRIYVENSRVVQEVVFSAEELPTVGGDWAISNISTSLINTLLKLEGSQQKNIRGGAMSKGREGLIPVIALQWNAAVSDQALVTTGLNKPKLSTLIIEKPLDRATPQIWNALRNREVMSLVELSIPEGPDVITASITKINLKDAKILNQKLISDKEFVEFEYSAIEFTTSDRTKSDLSVQN